jgi:hypothetical protein
MVLIGDAIMFTLLFATLLTITIQAGYWSGLSFTPPWLADITLIVIITMLTGIHFAVRSVTRHWKARKLKQQSNHSPLHTDLAAAFCYSTRPIRSMLLSNPAGWGRRTKKVLANVMLDTETYVQTLNDGFTNPSGKATAAKKPISRPD